MFYFFLFFFLSFFNSELSIHDLSGTNCNHRVRFDFQIMMNYTGSYYVSYQGLLSNAFAFHVQYPNMTDHPPSKIENTDIYWNNLDYYIHNQSTKTLFGSASLSIISGLKRKESSVLCLNVTAGEDASFIPSYKNKLNVKCISFQYIYCDDCPYCKLNTLLVSSWSIKQININ